MTPSEGSRFVRYEIREGVSIITLDRRPLNVYDAAFNGEFQRCWQLARDDDRTTAVLMWAKGRHFCAGANLRDPAPAPEGGVGLGARRD